MRRLAVYIETSVWSHWFAEDTPERREETQAFLRRCAESPETATVYVSDVVLQALAAAPPERARALLELVEKIGAAVAEASPEAEELAAAYLSHGALPPSRLVDAMHAAIATVHGIDVMASWNFRHLANVSRRRKINAVNAMMGYSGALEIVTPLEVFEDADQ